MKIGRITVSDRTSAGLSEDLSGPEIEAVCADLLPAPLDWERRLVPDEIDRIEAALRELADGCHCALVVTTGGTGITPRDVTPEATRRVIERELPGFGEAMRMRTMAVAPTSILSRAVAGTRGRTLIVNLPGRPKAVRECLEPLVPAIREVLRHLGGDHDH